MIAQAVVVVPHAWQLSPWIIAVGLFSGYWRTMVYQERWGYPQRWVKVLLVVTSVAGVAASQPQAVSLEAASSLLIVAFALKLIEMKTRRDAYIVIYLCYFTIATEFLFSQSIPVAVYEFGALVVVTAAMVGLNQLHTDARPLRSLKVAGVLVGQALPLMVVLFIFFPRLVPLWNVPLPSAARTGISSQVRPGDIANLIQSDEIAMRVVFDGNVPSGSSLYWRGVVYSDYEDGTWSANRAGARGDIPPPDPDLTPLRYTVLQEPTAQKWLFGLRVAYSESPQTQATGDFRMLAANALHSVYRNEVRSYVGQRMDAEPLEPRLRERETRLPNNANPRLRAFAGALYAESSDDEAFIARVLAHIRSAAFTYTLQPPTVPEPHGLDQFWFDTRRGFCSHYASAFVFVMRSVGIPARLVGGYQGGEVNPMGNHLVVRQYDAHAWSEVWIRGEGWKRVDPTGAVSPARIERGFSAALTADELGALSPFNGARLRDIDALADIMHFFDSLEHKWTLWVVGYDGAAQKRYLSRLLGSVTPLKVAMALLVAGGLTLLTVALMLLWRRGPASDHPGVRAFLRFSGRLARIGFVRERRESPAAFVARVGQERGLDPATYGPVIERLDSLLYNPDIRSTTHELKVLKRALRKLQFQLIVSTS